MDNTSSHEHEKRYFIKYEYYPVREDSEGNTFTCDRERAESWGIFGILNDKSLRHILSVTSEPDAKELVQLMEYRVTRTLGIIQDYVEQKEPWIHYSVQNLLSGVLRSSLTS